MSHAESTARQSVNALGRVGSAPTSAFPAETCEPGLTALYNGTCEVICPHPLYSVDEYEFVRLSYVVPGILGGLICLGLVADMLYLILSRRKRSSIVRKSRFFLVQTLGGLAGVVYCIIGPLQVLMRPASEPLGCALPVIPEVLHPADQGPQVSPVCAANRATIYAAMSILLVVLVHMTDTMNRLQQTSRGIRNISGRLAVCIPTRKRGLTLSFAVVFILCSSMYAADGHAKTSSPHYQGYLVRFSFFCGPRLEVAAELFLIKLPLAVIAVLVVMQTVRIRLVLRQLMVVSQTELSSSATMPLRNHLRKLGTSMAVTGFFCGIFSFIYIVCDAVLEVGLHAAADDFADWMRCRNDTDSSELYASTSCAETFARVSGSKFVSRPSPMLLALAYVFQSSLIAVFGAAYAVIAYQRRFSSYASMSMSMSMKKRRRHVQGQGN